MRINREYKPIVKIVNKTPGWDYNFTKKGHIRFIPPLPGAKPIVSAGSPSDVRSRKNCIAELRRAGLEIPHH